jgi:hypothetical protein
VKVKTILGLSRPSSTTFNPSHTHATAIHNLACPGAFAPIRPVTSPRRAAIPLPTSSLLHCSAPTLILRLSPTMRCKSKRQIEDCLVCTIEVGEAKTSSLQRRKHTITQQRGRERRTGEEEGGVRQAPTSPSVRASHGGGGRRSETGVDQHIRALQGGRRRSETGTDQPTLLDNDALVRAGMQFSTGHLPGTSWPAFSTIQNARYKTKD